MILNPAEATQVLDSPASSAVAIAAVLETTFTAGELFGDPSQNEEALDPTTIMMELEKKFNVELPSATRNKIHAILTLRSTEMFESDPGAFAAITLAFCEGQIGDMITGTLEMPDHIDAVWATFQAFIIDPEMTGLEGKVTAFVAALAAQDPADGSDDDAADFTERLADLQQELLRLGMTPEDVDQLVSIGMKTLDDVAQEPVT